MNKKFSFGKNWQRYSSLYVNEKIIYEAKKSLLNYLPSDEYKDKVFIDIGCGSGIFSLSSLLLGCGNIYSFDIDSKSVDATKELKNRFTKLVGNKRNNWEVFSGDILDERLIRKFYKKGDIVYSWGVLHHTGHMWRAIKNATETVKSNGYLILAIYNNAPSSEFWLKVKKFYNNHNGLIRFLLITILFSEKILGRLIRRKNPFKNRRGMFVFIDVIDWLGGYPYEFACFEEVKEFVEDLGFELVKAPTKLSCGKNKKSNMLEKIKSIGTGNNEFVFKKLI